MELETMDNARLAISETRQWDRLMELAEIGAIEGNGVNRQALTALDREARRLVIGWAEQIGAKVSVDEAANLWFRVEGSDPDAAPVLTGSHMDTQPKGGRFDGIYGVIAGLEAVAALHDAGIVTRRSIEVVAWTNEEGCRFGVGCTGSMSWAGVRPPDFWDARTDMNGVTYGAALAEHLQAEADLPRRKLGAVPYAYVEAHIEQGPLLEAEGIDVGIVTGIQGARWFTVTIRGETAHAGTAPLRGRRDALLEAVRVIAALSDAMHNEADILRFTVGHMVVSPNASNSVADEVVFSIDLRHPDGAHLTERGDAIDGVVQAALTTCTAVVHEGFNAQPVVFAPLVIDALEKAASMEGASARRLASGAFHDAQFASGVAPSGMIFVPCHKGISHNPAEFSSSSQLGAGTRVLAQALLRLAE
jgi:N-carbamoyl-L-amino-acid hydrolase